MTLEDIKTTQQEFEKSLELAKWSNFDGIGLHATNGSLADQFLRSFTNRRQDGYGGSARNRCKFVLELVDLALKYFRSYKIGIKISPTHRNNDMFD
jgi:N-ethylmaleimide reductase